MQLLKNGVVNIKDGTYTEGATNPANGLTFTSIGTQLIGQSKAGTIIVPVSNQYGYGLTSEGVGGISISNLTIEGTSTTGGAALKFHNFSGLTLTNVAVVGIGMTTPHLTGIDINSVSNVILNNVSVSGFGKNGIAVTAQYALTDVMTQNILFNNVSSNNNSWAGLAFYTSNNSGTVAGDITGVVFTGANQLENNGQGLFVEGDTDANRDTHGTPRWVVSGPGDVNVDLGNTTFSGNLQDIYNYQVRGLSALSAIFGAKTGTQMMTSERTTEDGLIIDHLDFANFGLVTYYNVIVPPVVVPVVAPPAAPVAPAAPTFTSVFTNAADTTAAASSDILSASTVKTTGNSAAVKGASTEKTKSSSDWALAWYWWVLIFAAVAAAIWWLIAAIRRRREQDQA